MAVVGSSAIRSAGFNAIAILIMILLQHAAGELMRVFLKRLLRIADPHAFQCLQ